MIPETTVNSWRQKVNWALDEQIEQDVILSRVLIELFSHKFLSKKLIFRGGTALQKLFLPEPFRYSEDIDLVQSEEGPIGEILDQIKSLFSPWLGKPRWKLKGGMAVVYFIFKTNNIYCVFGLVIGKSFKHTVLN